MNGAAIDVLCVDPEVSVAWSRNTFRGIEMKQVCARDAVEDTPSLRKRVWNQVRRRGPSSVVKTGTQYQASQNDLFSAKVSCRFNSVKQIGG